MKSRYKLLLSMILLVVSFGAVNVYAMDNGVYLVSTTTSYSNPTTGKITDGGSSNSALGESMCRSVIGNQALLEVENGTYYITVRMNLMSNISNINFKEQTSGNNYSSVSTTLMQQSKSADTADYRLKISDPSKYISASMFIGPMGRDVNFYFWINTSSAKAGKGDFVQTIKLQPVAPTPVAPEQAPNTNSNSSSNTTTGSSNSTNTNSSSASTNSNAASGNTSGSVSNSTSIEQPKNNITNSSTSNTSTSTTAPSTNSSSTSTKVDTAPKAENATATDTKKEEAVTEKATEKSTEGSTEEVLEVEALENAEVQEESVEGVEVLEAEASSAETSVEETVEESMDEAGIEAEETFDLEETVDEVGESQESLSMTAIVASLIIALIVAAGGAFVYFKKMRK